MNEIVAVRMDEEFLTKIDQLGREQEMDRSTFLRKLISKGYGEELKEKAFELYKQGKVTFSEAAHRAGLTVWEMREYMIEKGFVSSYSLEDLEQEMKLLNK